MTDMTIYVAEINGGAIAPMNADKTITAGDCFGGPGVHSKTDASAIRGRPSPMGWCGRDHVRPARSHEEEIWERDRATAVSAVIGRGGYQWQHEPCGHAVRKKARRAMSSRRKIVDFENDLLVIPNAASKIAHPRDDEAHLRNRRRGRGRLWKHIIADLGNLTFRLLRGGVEFQAKCLCHWGL
jgi:hypothetical protein